jgi:FkbM family methyltransferase
MKILYGQNDIWIECTKKFAFNDHHFIPANDINRYALVGVDPCPGVYKDIIIIKDNNSRETLLKNKSYLIFLKDSEVIISIYSNENMLDKYLDDNTYTNLEKLKRYIDYPPDSFNHELPEQAMIYSFLSPNAKVLEIGGNIGRSTAIIGKVLEKGDGEAYILETLKEAYSKNKNMCEKNGFKCSLINAALSEHNLVQKGWTTALEGSPGTKNWEKIPTITYEELKSQMGYEPTTLILDCEGAFTDILKSYPELLKSVDTIVIENDFRNIEDANYVHNMLRDYGFIAKVSIPLYDSLFNSNLPLFPCVEYFFEAYMKE